MKLYNSQLVLYIPTHANGNAYHKDCEVGIVFEEKENGVFVMYIRNGIVQHTAELTDKKNLKIISFVGNFIFNLNTFQYKLIDID